MAFTQATFINSLEVLPFFDELGFAKKHLAKDGILFTSFITLTAVALLGQEGLTGPRLTKIENSDEEVRKTYELLSRYSSRTVDTRTRNGSVRPYGEGRIKPSLNRFTRQTVSE